MKLKGQLGQSEGLPQQIKDWMVGRYGGGILGDCTGYSIVRKTTGEFMVTLNLVYNDGPQTADELAQVKQEPDDREVRYRVDAFLADLIAQHDAYIESEAVRDTGITSVFRTRDGHQFTYSTEHRTKA